MMTGGESDDRPARILGELEQRIASAGSPLDHLTAAAELHHRFSFDEVAGGGEFLDYEPRCTTSCEQCQTMWIGTKAGEVLRLQLDGPSVRRQKATLQSGVRALAHVHRLGQLLVGLDIGYVVVLDEGLEDYGSAGWQCHPTAALPNHRGHEVPSEPLRYEPGFAIQDPARPERFMHGITAIRELPSVAGDPHVDAVIFTRAPELLVVRLARDAMTIRGRHPLPGWGRYLTLAGPVGDETLVCVTRSGELREWRCRALRAAPCDPTPMYEDQRGGNMTSAEWLQLAPRPRPLSRDEKYHVFLSYRSVNRNWVLNLYDVLHEQGFEVFLDQVALTGGDDLIEKLEQGLSRSQAGILIWSSASADSEWVRKEYHTLERQATDRGSFKFVPVRLDTSELPPFARNRVFLDFSSYPDGPNGGELLRLLHSIVGQSLTPEAAHFADQQDGIAKEQANEVAAAVHLKDHQGLQQLFATGGLAWVTSSALGCKAAEGLIKLDKNTEAIAMLETLRARFPRAIRPKQLHALALARRAHGNDLRDAQRQLGTLYAAGERDPETLGIYGRTWMDRFTLSGDRADLEQSRNLYVEAFEKATDDYYTGVNAAAKSVFLGAPEDLERARDYAGRVQKIVGTKPRQGDYWMTATVGEVLLMQKKYRDAATVYKAGVAMALSEVASHKTTWLQAYRLMEKLQPSPEDRMLIRNAFAHLPEPPAP